MDNYCFPLSSEANCCHYQLPSNKSTIILVSLDQFSCGRKSAIRCFYFSRKPFCLVLGSPPRPAAFLALSAPTRVGCHLRGLRKVPRPSFQEVPDFKLCWYLSLFTPPPHTHVIIFFTLSIKYVTTQRFKLKITERCHFSPNSDACKACRTVL